MRVNNPESQVAADMVILRQEGFVASTSFIFWSCVDPAQSGGARTASPHRFARLSGGACRLKAKVFVRRSFSHFLYRSSELGGAFLLLDADLDAVQLQLQVRRLCTVSETCRSQAEPVLQREGGVSSGSRAQTALEKPGGFILLGCFLTNCSNFAVPKTEPVSRSRNRGCFPALCKLYAPEEVL